MNDKIALENIYGAQNYAPLPVVLTRGEGCYVWDEDGNKYLDMLGAYSAVSHGHCHPRIVKAMVDQAQILGVTSRAFHHDKLAEFLESACKLTGQDQALAMNTGAEAVETALKAARKWGEKVKGIKKDQTEIICCDDNFHGRTIAIVGMSSSKQTKDGFGPFPKGFKSIPFGDIDALEAAITPNTAAFLVEPIQGEGGVNVPPEGYLAAASELCAEYNVLLICDEIQTGLGRTGRLLACEHDGVLPDCLLLGKALGGGLMPVSLFLARKGVMDVFTPGDHGSTFGGFPIACAVGIEALAVLVEEELSEKSAEMGEYMLTRLQGLNHPAIVDVRGKGLLIGVELEGVDAHEMCERMLKRGILGKETHRNTMRFAPPLIITKEEIDFAIDQFIDALNE